MEREKKKSHNSIQGLYYFSFTRVLRSQRRHADSLFIFSIFYCHHFPPTHPPSLHHLRLLTLPCSVLHLCQSKNFFHLFESSSPFLCHLSVCAFFVLPPCLQLGLGKRFTSNLDPRRRLPLRSVSFLSLSDSSLPLERQIIRRPKVSNS